MVGCIPSSVYSHSRLQTGNSRGDRFYVQFVNVTIVKVAGVVPEVKAGYDPSSSVRQSTQCCGLRQNLG